MDICYIHLFKPIECATSIVNPNVNSGLLVIMVCQYRFISCDKCTALVGNINNERVCDGKGGQSI